MTRPRWFRFKSVRTKLIALFLLIGVLPAGIVATISYSQARSALIASTGSGLQAMASETADKLDQTFAACYGNVMAFSSGQMADCKPEMATATLDYFVRNFNIYDLLVLTDDQGKVIAVNSKTSDGTPIDAGSLIGASVKEDEWFKRAMSDAVTTDDAYYSDVYADQRLAELTKTRGLTVVYSSPIGDAKNKKVRVLATFVNWDRAAGAMIQQLNERRKERGALTATANVLNKQGLLLVDEQKDQILNFNLAESGLEAAKEAVSKKVGYTLENNKRTGEPQLNGYATSKGRDRFATLGWGVLVRQDAVEAFAAANQLAFFVAILTGGMALGIAAIGFFVARSFARPLVATAGALEQIAAGDLTKRVEVESQDEIGLVGECVNKLAGSLQEVVKKIMGSSRELASSSEELSSTAKEMAQSAEGTTQQSATVAAAAEEMATNMRTMAASTEEMSTNIKTVASAVEELTASVSEIARSAESSSGVASQAADLATVSNEKVQQLGQAADEIGKVIDVIQDIADQTNLLALNATIEAARAGEAGKGFAVVATEVKELAKQSAAATDSIRQRIQGMQGSTTETVKAIAEIGAAIKNVNDVARSIAQMVDQQSSATQEISRNIVQTSQAASSVSRGVTESASACQEITKTIIGVDQAAKSTAAGAAQTKSSGTQLSTLAESLQGLVVEFRV